MKLKRYNKEESIKQKQHLEVLASIITYHAKKHDIHVLRYNSKSSESIYLKFDYGLAGSLRLSAHLGKEHLNYTFNLIKGLSKPYKESAVDGKNIIHRYYYPEGFTSNLAGDIIRYREFKMFKYGAERYSMLKQNKKKFVEQRHGLPYKHKNKRSFWDMCVEV